jgi:hypothetical protein
MDMAYGIDEPATSDAYVARAELALEGFEQAAVPGAFLVDLLPWRKCIRSCPLPPRPAH